jgi:hypothetical protein
MVAAMVRGLIRRDADQHQFARPAGRGDPVVSDGIGDGARTQRQ